MSDKTETPPDPKRTLTEQELVSEQLPDWRMLIDRLHASFDTGDFVTAVKLVDAITLAAEEMNHHPDLDLAYGRLDIRLISHDVGGVTQDLGTEHGEGDAHDGHHQHQQGTMTLRRHAGDQEFFETGRCGVVESFAGCAAGAGTGCSKN